VAGVKLDNNTASTKQSERWYYMTSKPTNLKRKDGSVEFSETITKMRSISRRHCGWSGASTTTQEYETGEKTVLKCLFERAQRRNWRWAACLYQKRRDYHL
jgi:hypothetical protein